MTGRLAGKVALITGAARGQGRAEAVRFAEEGASLIVLDIAQKIDSASAVYGPATREQLEETVAMCEMAGAKVHSAIADTRDLAQMESVARSGSAELGGLDVVVANAGIYSVGRLAVADERTGLGVLSQETWQDMLDVNLTGVYNTVRATAPIMVEQGRGGAIVLTSSGAGLVGGPNIGHYVAAKHGVSGLMKSLAHELGPHWIRVNTVNPGQCNTAMIHNEVTYKLFRPDLEHPTVEDFRQASQVATTLPVPWVEPIDIANAVVFLASDEARYITGVALPVDAGTVV
jgi:(+)-trans-carveol dehydrogenase/(-)-trans-carveol dehydrogenase